MINIGIKASREDEEESFAEAALGWKFLNGNPSNIHDIDLLQVEPGKRAVGFYALLRSPKSFGGIGGVNVPGISDDNTSSDSNDNMIMAVGFVVFDEGNPRCTAHPTVEEQYQYEWAFANLDADWNQLLD